MSLKTQLKLTWAGIALAYLFFFAVIGLTVVGCATQDPYLASNPRIIYGGQ